MSTLRFSPRGLEVFMLAREGLTELQMAEHLGISVSGVKRHKEKMLARNGCKSMLALIARYHGMDEESSEAGNPQE